MWNIIKQQLVEKIIEEFKSKNNWNILKKHITDDAIDKYLIFPLLKKINTHLKKYIIIFVAIHLLIILLILFNILITLYYKK
jgi:hypothetical protein